MLLRDSTAFQAMRNRPFIAHTVWLSLHYTPVVEGYSVAVTQTNLVEIAELKAETRACAVKGVGGFSGSRGSKSLAMIREPASPAHFTHLAAV